MLSSIELAAQLGAKAEGARILKVPQSGHTPEVQHVLKQNGFYRQSLEGDNLVYKRRVKRATSVKPSLRANTAVLFKMIRRRLPELENQEIGALIGYSDSQTSHISVGNQALTDITKLRVLGVASGLSLDEMCDVLEGKY